MDYGVIDGLVNGTESVVFDYEVTGSAVSSISTGNILNGDEDGWYTIIIRMVGASGVTAAHTGIKLNNDSGSNYGFRGIDASSTTVVDYSGTAQTKILTQGSSGDSKVHFSISRIYAKTGSVRLVNMLGCSGITGTTVINVDQLGHVWNNTVDNLTNITFYDISGGSGLGVGTRIIILKDNNFTDGMKTGDMTVKGGIKGCWTRVGSQVLTSAASSVTFSGLDGDSDVIYYISAIEKALGGGINQGVRPNSVSTNTVYGRQYLYADNTSVAAAMATTGVTYLDFHHATVGKYSHSSMLLFAKSGFERTALTTLAYDISGTTVSGVQMFGSVWNNTADNITSLVILTSNQFDIGSQFDLYALYT